MNTSNLEALVAKITNALPQVKAVYVFGSDHFSPLILKESSYDR